MVLIGQDSEEIKEAERNGRGPAHNSRSVAGVNLGQNGAQGDMERGGEVKGLIEQAEPVKNRTQPALDVRALESKAQRKKEEANACYEDGKSNSFRQRLEFPLIAANKWRGDE